MLSGAMAGSVQAEGDTFRAWVRRRGVGSDIRGPRRGEKRKAEQDLAMLLTLAEQAGPEAAWSAMATESRRLQERAPEQTMFEALVAERVVDYATLKPRTSHVRHRST